MAMDSSDKDREYNTETLAQVLESSAPGSQLDNSFIT